MCINMWVRKSPYELLLERKKRKARAKYICPLLLGLSLYWIFHEITSVRDLIALYEQEPEKLCVILLLPLYIFVGFRSYTNHGGFGWVSDRVCLGCSKTWHHGNDGWGFLSFGKEQPKWYQFKACKTRDKCEIVGRDTVKWIPDKYEVDEIEEKVEGRKRSHQGILDQFKNPFKNREGWIDPAERVKYAHEKDDKKEENT